jgi:hypothetical protein
VISGTSDGSPLTACHQRNAHHFCARHQETTSSASRSQSPRTPDPESDRDQLELFTALLDPRRLYLPPIMDAIYGYQALGRRGPASCASQPVRVHLSRPSATLDISSHCRLWPFVVPTTSLLTITGMRDTAAITNAPAAAFGCRRRPRLPTVCPLRVPVSSATSTARSSRRCSSTNSRTALASLIVPGRAGAAAPDRL